MEIQHIKDRLRSKTTKNILATAAITLIVVVAFWAGMEVGFSKAAFSYHFGDNYYGAYGPHGIHHGPGFIQDDMSPAHGVSGKVVSVELPTLVVADEDAVEKVVRISDDTLVRKLRDTISASMLAAGDSVIIIGTPNEAAEVEARFIRVLPPSL